MRRRLACGSASGNAFVARKWIDLPVEGEPAESALGDQIAVGFDIGEFVGGGQDVRDLVVGQATLTDEGPLPRRVEDTANGTIGDTMTGAARRRNAQATTVLAIPQPLGAGQSAAFSGAESTERGCHVLRLSKATIPPSVGLSASLYRTHPFERFEQEEPTHATQAVRGRTGYRR